MRTSPQVSVSGIAHFEERAELCERLAEDGYSPDKHPPVLIGIQATTKSQALGLPSRRGPNWHPVSDDIWEPLGSELE